MGCRGDPGGCLGESDCPDDNEYCSSDFGLSLIGECTPKCRLGVSRSRVSTLLRGAMRKLNVQTRVQLVLKMREFQTMDQTG